MDQASGLATMHCREECGYVFPGSREAEARELAIAGFLGMKHIQNMIYSISP